MKRITLVLVMAVLTMMHITDVSAQTTEKQAKKALKDKPVKGARKEAKKWEKMGFTNLPGDPPLDKQFEVSMLKQFMYDEKGEPMYIVTMGSAIGGSEGVASANAMDNARIALAGQIQSQVSELITNNKANSQFSTTDIESIDEFILNSKTLIQQELGSLKPVIRMYRNVEQNVEYRYSTAYSVETAKNIARKIVKEELKSKISEDKEDQLNKLLGL